MLNLFFDKIDDIRSYSHYAPSQLQDIIKNNLNREINLKTLFDWTRTNAKMNRSSDYEGIEFLKVKNYF